MEFIKANVTIDPITQCWNWNKSVTSAGYGQFTRNKKYWTTHRFVYTQVYGQIPNKMVIRHKCHNTKCCNPEHLEIGTDKDNYYDSIHKHEQAKRKASYGWIINGISYYSLREAVKATGISMACISKYTNKETRVFDTDAYKAGVKKSNRWSSKI